MSVQMNDASTMNRSQELTVDAFVLTNMYNASCAALSVNHTKLPFNPKAVSESIQFYVQTNYHCQARLVMDTELTVILRFKSRTTLDGFFGDYVSGRFVKSLQQAFISYFLACNQTLPRMHFSFTINRDDLTRYCDVHIQFQGIHYCLLIFIRNVYSTISFVFLLFVW